MCSRRSFCRFIGIPEELVNIHWMKRPKVEEEMGKSLFDMGIVLLLALFVGISCSPFNQSVAHVVISWDIIEFSLGLCWYVCRSLLFTLENRGLFFLIHCFSSCAAMGLRGVQQASWSPQCSYFQLLSLPFPQVAVIGKKSNTQAFVVRLYFFSCHFLSGIWRCDKLDMGFV